MYNTWDQRIGFDEIVQCKHQIQPKTGKISCTQNPLCNCDCLYLKSWVIHALNMRSCTVLNKVLLNTILLRVLLA